MAPSIWQLLIVAVIVALIFGTKRLRDVGGDLGAAIRGFKKALNEDPKESKDSKENNHATENQAIDKSEHASLDQATVDQTTIQQTSTQQHSTPENVTEQQSKKTENP